MTICPNCGHEFKPAPRIQVPKHGSFFVDLAHGIATDTFSLGPLSVFKGKTVKTAIALAQASDDQFAKVNSKRDHPANFVNEYTGKILAKADPVPVEKTYKGYWTDLSAGDLTVRVNSEFHAAMSAVSDAVLIDTNPFAPVIYLKDDTVVGLVMPIRRGDNSPCLSTTEVDR